MKSHFSRGVLRSMLAAALAVGAAPVWGQFPGGPLPASPLAGGSAAASGGQFMDASGNPIIMPTQYCEPAGSYGGPTGADGGACYGGGGGCGDGSEAYADFGGYSQPDQCGPHYFDVSTQALALQGEQLFGSAPALGSIGVQGDKILDPKNTYNDYEAGWQIAARHDFGPLSVLEATYFGIYNLGFNDTVRSVDVAPGGDDFQLNSVFSNYGVAPIDGLDEGSVYSLNYKANLQSTELSYRRYWVGFNPRISGTYLVGARYLRLAETLAFNTVALNGSGSITSRGYNDMVGFQFGGDGWIALRQGLRIGTELKSGIYNNSYEFNRSATFPNVATTAVQNGDNVAFAGEASLDMVADILPSWSIRGGYRVLYMDNLATVGNNIPATLTATTIGSKADALFHGFQFGVEYVW